MKLYTEVEILSFLQTQFLYEIDAETFMNNLKPIELPSDEEIEKQSPFKESTFGFEQGQYQGFILGAKFLKEQITKTK